MREISGYDFSEFLEDRYSCRWTAKEWMSAISNKLLAQIKMTAIRSYLQQKFPATWSNHRLPASICTTQFLIRCWNGCAVIYGVERFEKWSIAAFGQKEVPMSREIREQRVGDGIRVGYSFR